MATKKCKFCQTEIDSKAKICPTCKKDLRGWFAKHPVLTVILGLFVLGIIITASGGGSKPTTTTPIDNKTGTDNKKSGGKEEKTAILNTDLIVGDAKWRVIKARTADQLYDYSGAVKPAGKFLVVNVVVENLGKDMKTVTGLKVVDDQNREFISYSKGFGLKNLGAEMLSVLDNINPNVPLTFADVYEIPADAKGLKLKVGDLSFLGSEAGFIDLGL